MGWVFRGYDHMVIVGEVTIADPSVLEHLVKTR